MSETPSEETQPNEDAADANAETTPDSGDEANAEEADNSEAATGNDPDSMPSNEAAAPTPAGTTQEGGSTVEEQTVNVVHNEEKLNEDREDA